MTEKQKRVRCIRERPPKDDHAAKASKQPERPGYRALLDAANAEVRALAKEHQRPSRDEAWDGLRLSMSAARLTLARLQHKLLVRDEKSPNFRAEAKARAEAKEEEQCGARRTRP